jgi:hypothetical protein
MQSFGDPEDEYYAEAWADGMDWNLVVWAVRDIMYGQPEAVPLVVFESREAAEKYNPSDFRRFIRACFWCERAKVLSGDQDQEGVYQDDVWCNLKQVASCELKTNFTREAMIAVRFAHNSQSPITFWLNPEFYPDSAVARDDKYWVGYTKGEAEAQLEEDKREATGQQMADLAADLAAKYFDSE